VNSDIGIFLKQSGPGVRLWPVRCLCSWGWAEMLVTRESTSPPSLDASRLFCASLGPDFFRFVSEHCVVLVKCLLELV